MTDRDIDGLVTALAEALEQDDKEIGKQALIQLATGALKTIVKIGDALEAITRNTRETVPWR